MPIFKAAGKLVYFAHIPKCAGSAVEAYVAERFGQVAFLDRTFVRGARFPQWNVSSPQHIPRADLSLLFPDGFFDDIFTVVRHPVQRLISAYHYHRSASRISGDVGFPEWLRSLPDISRTDPWAYDNHARPMHHFTPAGTVYFRLENGLGDVVRYLDRIAGDSNGSRTITPLLQRRADAPTIIPTEADLDLITSLYAPDFKLFGYDERSLA